MDSHEVTSYAQFLVTASAIKQTPRTGWLLHGLSSVEPVACHMWAMTAAAVLRLPSWEGCTGADVNHLAALCLAHDLAEAIVGDLTPHCGVPPDEKLRREQAALAGMAAKLDAQAGTRLTALFDEYNEQSSWEARLAKELDRLDMCCQALHYAISRPKCPNLAEFALSSLPKAVVPGVAKRIQSIAAALVLDSQVKTTSDPPFPPNELTEFSRLKEVELLSSLDVAGDWRPKPVLLGCHQYMLCLMGITLPASCLGKLGGSISTVKLVRAVGLANFLPNRSAAFCQATSADCPFDVNEVSQDSGLESLIADLTWLDVALDARAAGNSAEAATAGVPRRIDCPFLRLVCERILRDGEL